MNAERNRVPAIPSTPEENLLYELLMGLAVRLSTILTAENIQHGFFGGTALKLAYGLTRPSTDLDIKVEQPRSFHRYVKQAFEGLSDWSFREPTADEWNAGAEGIIVLHAPTGQTLSTRIDFVPGPLHEGDTGRIDNDSLEMHHGIQIFKLPKLAEYKLNALVGPNARTKARDLYDAAWLMEHCPDAIEPATKDRLSRWHHEVTTSQTLYARWEHEFRTPDIGDHVPLETLLSSLADSFETQA